MEKFTPLARNFTLPPGLTGWTNFTSALIKNIILCATIKYVQSYFEN